MAGVGDRVLCHAWGGPPTCLHTACQIAGTELLGSQCPGSVPWPGGLPWGAQVGIPGGGDAVLGISLGVAGGGV